MSPGSFLIFTVFMLRRIAAYERGEVGRSLWAEGGLWKADEDKRTSLTRQTGSGDSRTVTNTPVYYNPL